MSETDIKRQITDWLDAKGIWWERMNAGDRFGSYKGKAWRIVGCRAGTADLLAAPMTSYGCNNCWEDHQKHPLLLFIEVKKPGEKQSAEQKSFEADVKSRGMHYLVATSFEDVAKYLETL